ncbi:MAG TPA: GAF domain-containing protein, partial [Acidimicrobiales bacterium]|nr:GAF domain-containing protein [Acidimicrobiales bacterium]
MSASEADRQLAWAGLLRRIIEITAEDLDRREVVQRVAALVIEATGADVCFVHLVDEERNVLVLTGATPPFDQLAGTIELAIGEGVSGWVAQHGTPLVVDDKWSDPRYKYIPALKGEDYASLVSLPLIRQASQVVGVVNVHSRERRDYAPDELALLVDVAGLL